jgi:hypothetical protein
MNIFSVFQPYYEDQWLDLDKPSLVSLELHSKQLQDPWLDLE